jgi:uncharacterized repeat protein (TIGR01451 family)
MATNLTIDDNTITVVPGTDTTYTIVVSNTGPTDVIGASVSDPLPVGVTGAIWQFEGATNSGSVSGPTSGIGDLLTTVDLPVDATVTFSFTATIDPSATGDLVNMATVSPPGDPLVTVVDTDTLTPEADLSVIKTDGVTSVVPGTVDPYLITVTNNGPSTVSSVILTDPPPVGALATNFVPSVGAYNVGTGEWSGLNLASGDSATMTLDVAINPSATGSLTNTVMVAAPAGVTDTNTTNNTFIDIDTLTPQADLRVAKTDGVTSIVGGTSTTYLITVTNNGPSTVGSVTLTDPLPDGALSASFGMPSAGSYDPGSGLWSGLNLTSGDTVSMTLSVTIDPNATSLTNIASVTPPVGVTDPNTADNTVTDTDTLIPEADLAIIKTDGVTTVVAGTVDTYTIVVTNNGPSTAVDAVVTDVFPAAFTVPSWTAVASPGSTVAQPIGTGDISTPVTLLPGGTATFTAVAQIDPSATGLLTNTAMVSAPAGGTDPDLGNNTATATDTITIPAPSIQVVKFVNGQDADSPTGPHVAAGSTVTFTYVVTDTGNVPLANVVVIDNKLGAITTFTGDDGDGLLDLTETWTYTATATALAGQQTNLGIVTAQDPNIGTPVADDNPANYFGGTTAIAFALPTFELPAFGPSAGGWSSDNTYPRALADVSGDGLADIVGFSSAGVYKSLATGGGQFAMPTFELEAFGTDAGNWSSDNTYPRELADVNGDSMADIVGFGQSGVYVSLATAGGPFAMPTFELDAFGTNAGNWSSDNTYPRTLADINNDGKADIVGFGQSGVYVSLATGDGHFAMPTFELDAFGTNAGNWSSNDTYPRELADVNGDSMADIVGFGQAGVYVSLATGGGHFAAPTFELAAFGTDVGGWTSQDLYPRTLADVNADGMADIVGFGTDGVFVSLATGGGHFASPPFQLAAFGPDAGGWNSDNTYPRQLADITGNGSADIVGFAANGVWTAPSLT